MSLNKVMLIGNVGKDPDIRYVDNGVCTAQVSLATSTPGYTLPNGTQVPERAEWHRVMLWRRQAEIVERYVRKGDKLYVEGQLRTRSYTDKRGQTRYVTEVWADRIEMLGKATGSQPSPAEQAAPSSGDPAPAATAPSQPFAAPAPEAPASQTPVTPNTGFNGPMPF